MTRSPFLEGPEKLVQPKNHRAVYAHILNINIGSLYTRRFRRIHFSAFKYRLNKNGFAGPKNFRGTAGLSLSSRIWCEHSLLLWRFWVQADSLSGFSLPVVSFLQEQFSRSPISQMPASPCLSSRVFVRLLLMVTSC